MTSFIKKNNPWIGRAFPIAIACLIPFVLGQIVNTRGDFYNELWGPAYLLVHGQSPYDTTTLNPTLPAVWLPMGIVLFAPLGWLDEKIAAYVWFLLNVIEVPVIAYLALGHSRWASLSGASLLLIYFFPSTVQHLTLGQFSMTGMMSIMIAAHFVDQNRDWPAAFFLVLSCTKPQLAVLAMITLGYFFFMRSGLSGLLRFGAKVCIATFLLTLPLFIIYPGWIPDFLRSIQSNPGWMQPSLISILMQTSLAAGFLLLGFVAAGGVAASIYLMRKLALVEAISWILALTTVVSPYIWSWDFVLLLPLWISTLARSNTRNRLFLMLTYLVGWTGMLLVQTSKDNNNQMFWWVPLWFIGTILVANIGATAHIGNIRHANPK